MNLKIYLKKEILYGSSSSTLSKVASDFDIFSSHRAQFQHLQSHSLKKYIIDRAAAKRDPQRKLVKKKWKVLTLLEIQRYEKTLNIIGEKIMNDSDEEYASCLNCFSIFFTNMILFYVFL